MLTQELADRIARIKVADLSDACRGLGVAAQLSGPELRPAVPFSRLCGTAVTARIYVAPGAVDITEQVASVFEPGHTSVFRPVFVYQNDIPGFTAVGSGNGRVGLLSGFVGCLAGGPIRDTEELRDMPYPVFGTAVIPGGIRIEDVPAGSSMHLEVSQPVRIAGMLVRPGDVVVADNDGAICIPPERLADVVADAEAILADDERLFAAMENGVTWLEFHRRERRS